jgi:4-hydroxy-3-polyprenylbenzoate decarboxylase
MRQIGYEGIYYKFLKHDCNIVGVLDVAFFESSGSWLYCVIKMEKTNPSEPWQALKAASAFNPSLGKIIIAVDEDINLRDPDEVNWALSFRMQPHLDVLICEGMSPALDPSAAPPGTPREIFRYSPSRGTSAMLIDATRKWPYTPVSLPRKEYMEAARKIWEELKLPPLKVKDPWHGYSLGDWNEENEEEAQLATQGNYYRTTEKLEKTRVKI